MIVETKNSSYEIKGKWIRKVSGSGECLGENFTTFDSYVFKPEIGKPLMISFGQRYMRTSIITAIIAEAHNEED